MGAAEGQFALRSGRPLTAFSEEMLVDCEGWDRPQFPFFQAKGFMTSAAYPYNDSAYPDSDPPVPGNPCKFDAAKVVEGTAFSNFTDSTGAAPSEDQMAAFIFKNGPLQTGINANVFGLRAKGCEARGDCFITKSMCASVTKQIDHSILLVGYGTDPVEGDYWSASRARERAARHPAPCPPHPTPERPALAAVVKNSWSTAFANQGFINVARGVNCGDINCCGNTFTYGDPASYYNESLVL